MSRTTPNHWLMKSEPFKYSWDDLVAEGEGTWDGVRNYLARNNLMAMQVGDEAFFYHSREGLEIVGIAKVVKEFYQDPTTDEEAWVVVDLAPVRKLKKPVTLAQIKATKSLANMAILKLGRLSVTPVTAEEWEEILSLANS
jgi:predicted RNA-binding protein with PUA-like domain